MTPIEQQRLNENKYCRKHIDGMVEEELLAQMQVQAQIKDGVARLEAYRSQTYSYASKNERMAQIQHVELEPLVVRMLVAVARIKGHEKMASLCGQLAGSLGFSEKAEGVRTVAEMVAVLCLTDAFDIARQEGTGELVVASRLRISEALEQHIAESQYIPPMVCKPNRLETNWDSGYLTFDECIISKGYNSHGDDVCLDAVNIQNQTPLKLDEDFLALVQESPTFTFTSPEQIDQWKKFQETSAATYQMLLDQGNRFYLTHKLDKRGRLYCRGYHVSYQGTAFKKAIVDFADTEVVEGVPARLKIPA